MVLLILALGFVFGMILQYADLNKFNVISGLATLDNLAVAKAIALAIGIGAILLSITIGFDLASFHVKPFIPVGIILGGIIFGTGMAILGYCPGTLFISLGEGSLDALTGMIGGLAGGLIFTLLLPYLGNILGPDLGIISLNSLVGSGAFYYLLTFLAGSVFVVIAFWLNKKDKTRDKRWLLAGIALAILNVFIFSIFIADRPIGASTTFPYLADLLSGTTNNEYFNKIEKSGRWEFIFLAGAFLAGLIASLYKREFKLTFIHTNWRKYKGTSVPKRIGWSFLGGFILILGARMAGGCTSGHILSGGMQLSLSSLVFAIFTFAGLLFTGKMFYRKSLSS